MSECTHCRDLQLPVLKYAQIATALPSGSVRYALENAKKVWTWRKIAWEGILTGDESKEASVYLPSLNA